MLKKVIRLVSIFFLLILFGTCLKKDGIKLEEDIWKAQETKIIWRKKEVYYAILQIPKINLERELYPSGHLENDVDKNLFVHEISVMPKDGNNSMVVIAGHSGTSKIAYFKNLYKLGLGDEVRLYYNGFVYKYIIREIEYQKKTGRLALKTGREPLLILITCTRNDDEHQTIYYARLENSQEMMS